MFQVIAGFDQNRLARTSGLPTPYSYFYIPVPENYSGEWKTWYYSGEMYTLTIFDRGRALDSKTFLKNGNVFVEHINHYPGSTLKEYRKDGSLMRVFKCADTNSMAGVARYFDKRGKVTKKILYDNMSNWEQIIEFDSSGAQKKNTIYLLKNPANIYSDRDEKVIFDISKSIDLQSEYGNEIKKLEAKYKELEKELK